MPTLISTEVITLATGTADPAAVDITIPADCTAVYVFWDFYLSSGTGGISSVTLNGVGPSQSFEFPADNGAQYPGAGVDAWYNPATGTRSLDYLFDASVLYGPIAIAAYVKDGELTAWTDADAQGRNAGNNATITLTTSVGDLLIKLDTRLNDTDVPANSSGWTSQQTQIRTTRAARLATKAATGTSEVINTEDDSWSSVVAVSIPNAPVSIPTGRGLLLGVG